MHPVDRSTNQYKFHPLAPIGWLLSAFSILNLIQDAKVLSISGKLKDWLETYRQATQYIHNNYFHWFHLKWIKFSTLDLHLTIIFSVLLAAFFRTLYHTDDELKKAPRHRQLQTLAGSYFIVVLFFVIFLALIPDSLWMFQIFLVFGLFFNTEKGSIFTPQIRLEFYFEVAGVVTVALVLLALSSNWLLRE